MNFLKHLGNLLKDFVGFSMQHKKWWMIPIILVFLVMALLIVVGQSTAPFIYTIF